MAFHSPCRPSQASSSVSGALGRLVAAHAGDPAVGALQRPFERLDLAQEAAAVGIGRPQVGDPLARERLDGDAVALLHPPPGVVGLLEQGAGVEREDAGAGRVFEHQVDQHRGLLLPRRGERETVVAEAFGGVADDLCGAVRRHRTVKPINSGRDSENKIRESHRAFGTLCRMEPTTTSGRKGSIENPEVREDVPGHVIPILQREFDDFDGEAEKYLAGDTPENEFIGFRLKQGVYGQRQADVQMMPHQAALRRRDAGPDGHARGCRRALGAARTRAHITTRQNIQIHHVPLRDMAELIRAISDSGLSTREGCGNTVRNVTADPWAGVCHDELWDPTPYVGAYVRYFVRHPTTQLMPRKVKTAFTGSDTDRALTGIHDIAFIARERDGVRGFELRIGGGTSIMPRVAPTLDRVRDRRRRRVPQVGRGRLPHLRPPGLAARQPRPRAHQGPRRQDRHRGDARARRGGAAGRLGRRARLLDRSPALPPRRGGERAGAAARRPGRRTATGRSSRASSRPTSSASARPGSRPSRSRWCAAT